MVDDPGMGRIAHHRFRVPCGDAGGITTSVLGGTSSVMGGQKPARGASFSLVHDSNVRLSSLMSIKRPLRNEEQALNA